MYLQINEILAKDDKIREIVPVDEDVHVHFVGGTKRVLVGAAEKLRFAVEEVLGPMQVVINIDHIWDNKEQILARKRQAIADAQLIEEQQRALEEHTQKNQGTAKINPKLFEFQKPQ